MPATISSAEYRELSRAPKRGRFPVAPKHERTIDGIAFRSKCEMLRYADLKRMQDFGLISDLKFDAIGKAKTIKPMTVQINGYEFCSYTPDFEYRNSQGHLIIEDVKTSGTAKEDAYKLRKRACELYYGIKIVEVL